MDLVLFVRREPPSVVLCPSVTRSVLPMVLGAFFVRQYPYESTCGSTLVCLPGSSPGRSGPVLVTRD